MKGLRDDSLVFTPAFRGGSGSPLVCLHGFMDTWRTWELVLPHLTRRHDVLAPTLPGHAGAAPIKGDVSIGVVLDAVEEAMDAAGFASAHLVGNSLGGYVALGLAARGRARTVVALAPAGGWAAGDDSYREMLARQAALHREVKAAAPHAESVLATAAGRRRATELLTVNVEHLPVELLDHLIRGVAACTAVEPMIANASLSGWPLQPELVTCPVRIIWGTDDRLLPWPSAAARYREWFPQADWIELEGVGHCPQLDVPLETASLITDFTA